METTSAQPTRSRILDDVRAHPGSSAREIQRRLSLGWGDVAYQLDVLVRRDALRRERGGWRDYYFDPGITWEERKVLQSLHSPAERAILLVLGRGPGFSLGELVERVRLSKSTVSFHLSRLTGLGVVTPFYDSGVRRYRVRDPERLERLLTTYRSSLGDQFVDRFAEAFGSLR